MTLMAVAFLLTACSSGHHAPPPTPVITMQPADMSVVADGNAAFSVMATGESPVYQWQTSTDDGASWTNISGATATSYSLTGVAMGDSGHLFRVLVTAAGATVASSPARLTVTATAVAPAITVQPLGQTVTDPATATFSVTATGTALQYQWQLSSDGGSSWMDLSGATSASYTTPSLSAGSSGLQYRVQVSNTLGSVTSNAVVVIVNVPGTVYGAPFFYDQPYSQSVIAGSTATFSVSVGDLPTPSVQWQRSDDGGVSWADIAGASGNNYTTPATVAGDDGAQFRVIASNSEGSATSDAVTLTVTAASAPVFTTQPQNGSAAAGTEVIFTVVASGTPGPTYQWQESTDNGTSWSNIYGATNASLDVVVNRSTSQKKYRAVASNSEGTAFSGAVMVEMPCELALVFSDQTASPYHLQYLNNLNSVFCPTQNSSSMNPDTGNYTVNFKDVSAITNGWTMRVEYQPASQGMPEQVQVTYLHPSDGYLSNPGLYFPPFSCPNTGCTNMTVDMANHFITFNGTALFGPVTGDGDAGSVTLRGTLSFP